MSSCLDLIRPSVSPPWVYNDISISRPILSAKFLSLYNFIKRLFFSFRTLFFAYQSLFQNRQHIIIVKIHSRTEEDIKFIFTALIKNNFKCLKKVEGRDTQREGSAKKESEIRREIHPTGTWNCVI